MEDEKGQTRSFIVTRMDDETLTVDGNDPLCGREVVFGLEILAVRDATDEEMKAGGAMGAVPDIDPTGRPARPSRLLAIPYPASRSAPRGRSDGPRPALATIRRLVTQRHAAESAANGVQDREKRRPPSIPAHRERENVPANGLAIGPPPQRAHRARFIFLSFDRHAVAGHDDRLTGLHFAKEWWPQVHGIDLNGMTCPDGQRVPVLSASRAAQTASGSPATTRWDTTTC